MNMHIWQSDRSQQPAWSVPDEAPARLHPPRVPTSRNADFPWRKRLMDARAVALQLATAALLLSSLLSSTAAAVDPAKQPIYSNTPGGLLCGTDSVHPDFPPNPCAVPAGQRLIIEHVSGYTFLPTSITTTVAVSLVITDPQLGLNDAAFHTFVATKTATSGGTDVFSFSTPFRMMLHPGATFYFSWSMDPHRAFLSRSARQHLVAWPRESAQGAKMGTTEDLARFIAETQYDDLPAEVVAAAKIGILDGVANLLAGSTQPVAQIASAYTRELGGTPVASVIGHSFKTNPLNAALPMGSPVTAWTSSCRASPPPTAPYPS
jgi:hypothetical protein